MKTFFIIDSCQKICKREKKKKRFLCFTLGNTIYIQC